MSLCWSKRKAFAALAAGLAIVLAHPGPAWAKYLIDGYEPGTKEVPGQRSIYYQEPAKVVSQRTSSVEAARGRGALSLLYDKKSIGGEYNIGGWCGYYHTIGSPGKWFDATLYKKLTFYVMGAEGGENFRVGVADENLQKAGDSYKSKLVTEYISGGRITKSWRLVEIPLDEFMVYTKRLASVSICFEGETPNTPMKGRVYIDELAFE